MTISGDFDFIHAKVHGLRSRVYELDRLDALCHLRTVEQLWHRLYPDREAGTHRELQRRLLADHIETLRGVREHLPAQFEPLFSWLMRRFQVENIKVLLRAWKAGAALDEVAPFLAPLPDDLALSVKAMLKARHVADLLLAVPERRLRQAAEDAVRHFLETEQTFFLEAALDRAYYLGLLEEQAGLRGVHASHTEPLVHLEVAVYNVLTLFRLKLSYGLPFEEARGFFVPGAPPAFRLERLYDYPEFDDMVRLVPREMLPREPAPALDTVADLERALWQRLLQVANRQFYRSTGDVGAVVAFATIKRVELANVIRVVEGVRYGLDAAAIRAGLIEVAQPVAGAG